MNDKKLIKQQKEQLANMEASLDGQIKLTKSLYEEQSRLNSIVIDLKSDRAGLVRAVQVLGQELSSSKTLNVNIAWREAKNG